jgi:hypothetical protein
MVGEFQAASARCRDRGSCLAEEAEKVHAVDYSHLSRTYGFWLAIVGYNVLALGNVLKT